MITDETIVKWIGGRDRQGFRIHGPGAGAEGVVLLTDPKELYYPPFDHKLRQSATGRARWIRANTTYASGDFVVDINPDGPGGFQAAHDRWMRSWSESERGWFAFFTPGIGWWYRRSRLVSEDFAGRDPLPQGTQLEVLHISDDGAWIGLPDVSTWKTPTSATDRYVSGFIPVRNRGQMDAWVRYELPGPGQWHIADANGGYVELPFIAAGETLLVDTDEENPTVKTTSGASRWPQTRGRFMLPAQPTLGDAVELREVGVKGGVAGQVVTAVVTPRRRSPW